VIVIRECRGFEELQACVDLQIEVWGYSDGDVIPRRVFLVGQKIGGQVIGAFDTALDGVPENGDASSLIGFAFALPGAKTGRQSRSGRPESYLHSHMLAVRESYRNQNIGARLKMAQRDDALARGIERMEWTFDPVEIKNSFLNIHKLGAIVRTYTSNFYGVSSSRLQGGLPSDRLHAEWYLRSARVRAVLAGAPLSPPNIEATILVPHQVGEWKSSETDADRARTVQTENRQRFQAAFHRGLAVVGFHRDTQNNGIFELAPFEHLRSDHL